MYTPTKLQIVEIIKKNGQVQVKDLVRLLGLTQAAVHRALNKLMAEEVLTKRGTPPQVFYFLNIPQNASKTLQIPQRQQDLLSEHYAYITPVGKIETGLEGFLQWMRATRNQQKPEKCIEDYLQILEEAQSHKKNNFHLIEATERFSKVFPQNNLDRVFYHDFYSLIKFGKTKMGQFLLNGKQSQDKALIKKISDIVAPDIRKLIKLEKIEAVAWAPHSIPRKVPFLKEVEKNLNLDLPTIEVIKLYAGDVPIAQKSLSKLEERIQNARETMVVVPTKIKASKVLLIDDAVGSGSTLNEIAQKIKARGVKHILGFAIVGSYKGFEVIKEV